MSAKGTALNYLLTIQATFRAAPFCRGKSVSGAAVGSSPGSLFELPRRVRSAYLSALQTSAHVPPFPGTRDCGLSGALNRFRVCRKPGRHVHDKCEPIRL